MAQGGADAAASALLPELTTHSVVVLLPWSADLVGGLDGSAGEIELLDERIHAVLVPALDALDCSEDQFDLVAGQCAVLGLEAPTDVGADAIDDDLLA